MTAAPHPRPIALSLLYAGEPDRVPSASGWRAEEPEPIDAVALSELQPNELWRINDVHGLLASLTYEVRLVRDDDAQAGARAAGVGAGERPGVPNPRDLGAPNPRDLGAPNPRDLMVQVGALLDPVLPEAPRGCGGGCGCGAGGCGASAAPPGAQPERSASEPEPERSAAEGPARQPSETLRAVRLHWSGEVIPVDALAAMAGQGPGWSDRLGFLVRHFTVQGDGAVVVDTVGLEGLGLPDLQLHTSDMASTDAIAVVDALAKRLLADGDPGDGGTLADEAGAEWTAAYAGALAPPAREILDLSR